MLFIFEIQTHLTIFCRYTPYGDHSGCTAVWKLSFQMGPFSVLAWVHSQVKTEPTISPGNHFNTLMVLPSTGFSVNQTTASSPKWASGSCQQQTIKPTWLPSRATTTSSR